MRGSLRATAGRYYYVKSDSQGKGKVGGCSPKVVWLIQSVKPGRATV
jgi:hypothetical protein